MSVDLPALSRRLFQVANQLWANTALRPDQYAQPVLALIALRQMEAKFDLVHADLSKTFTGLRTPVTDLRPAQRDITSTWVTSR